MLGLKTGKHTGKPKDVFKHTGNPKDVFRKDSTYQKSKNSYSSDDCEAEFFSVNSKRNMPNF